MLITKNGKVIRVTKGAFKDIFKKDGWREAKSDDLRNENRPNGDLVMKPTSIGLEDTEDIEDGNGKRVNDIPFGNLIQNDEEDIDEDEDEDEEKPLSEMTVPELRAFADEHDIELGDATKKDDIRKIISKAIEEMEE